MSDFWDSRYSETEYAYGLEPNEFFRTQARSLQAGKMLFPAEGEGRNAVYAARKGHDVWAFDWSQEGKKKAMALAGQFDVNIHYEVNTYQQVDYPPAFFDAIVFIFTHMPENKRREWHRKFIGYLKPGGRIILEGFSRDQIELGTGGPGDVGMLFDTDEIREDFESLQEVILDKTLVTLDEGLYHKGKASVVRGVFQK